MAVGAAEVPGKVKRTVTLSEAADQMVRDQQAARITAGLGSTYSQALEVLVTLGAEELDSREKVRKKAARHGKA